MIDLEMLSGTLKSQPATTTVDAETARELIRELRTRRQQADADLRFVQARIAEVTHLKRRISIMRSGLLGLAEIRCLDGVDDMAKCARADLERDDEIRRRFQRKAAAHG